MGIFDTILGRTKPVRANLDALFALPSAAVTLQAAAGLVPTGQAGVCFKPPAGQAFAQMQADVEQLLRTADDPSDTGGGAASDADLHVRHVADNFGYRWIIVEGGGIDDVVTRAHMVHSSLEDAGWSTQLLCSVFGFHPGAEPGADPDALGDTPVTQPLYLVYLAKRGTFYPFAPTGGEQRDSELELRIRGIVGSDLPIEEDLSRWFPLWGMPLN
ncbi:MAG TPA: hypothetical protein VEJ87_03055 [Acidimicrobiales bacterium]|nr:hypothetical protein [Acidimicrobiales bacterium]